MTLYREKLIIFIYQDLNALVTLAFYFPVNYFMSDFFSYSNHFILDKIHFTECYSESVNVDHSVSAYSKAIISILLGIVLVLVTDINPYAAWFIFALGIVEAFSIYYQKPWWITRQMFTKSAKAEVLITINEQGIKTDSFYFKYSVLWQDVMALTATELGWLVIDDKGKNYISNRCLSTQAIKFLSEKSESIKNNNT